VGSRNQQGRAGKQRERHFLHRRTLYCFVNRIGAANNAAAPWHTINENQNLIGLVNRSGVSIHHFAKCALNSPTAFILHERRPHMVNRRCAALRETLAQTVPA
jgi:hypothetical protein